MGDGSEPDPGAAPRTLPQSALRVTTDRRLLQEVIDRGRVTRAELAAVTGFSKPTVSEAVRRLAATGLVAATGPKETSRRGRVATFYELGPAAGWVLAIEVNQGGVAAWSADLAGRVRHRHERPPAAVGDTGALADSLRAVASEAVAAGGDGGPLRAVGVSMAGPVHPATHEVIPLPDAPFPEGQVSASAVLTGLVRAPVLVDNDVNLAALAEHRSGAAAGTGSFAYVYVGGGLGLGLYVGGRLLRGAHGLAGEIGYLPAAGPGTLAAELIAGGFGRPGAPATDVDAVVGLLDRARAGDQDARRAAGLLAAAVARAVASVTAVVDPELVLLGGPVGTHPELLAPVRQAADSLSPLPTRLAHGALGPLAPLHGATHLALEHARTAAVTP